MIPALMKQIILYKKWKRNANCGKDVQNQGHPDYLNILQKMYCLNYQQFICADVLKAAATNIDH